ncbi:MAG: hypothetical protein JST75_06660 [Bacteroidetes bacterium]|nr:hypothetical protein [Bacteroidota bacterium]
MRILCAAYGKWERTGCEKILRLLFLRTIKPIMKRIKTFATAIFILSFATFNACKKNNDKKPDCKINSITSPNSPGQQNTFSYDANGKLSRFISAGNFTSYSYSGNTTTVTALDSGKFSSRTTIVSNDAGLAIDVRTEGDEAGTQWTNGYYEYNGDELIKSTTTSSGGGAAVVTTYTWSNHNMVSSLTDTTTTIFGYYTDKPVQNGDYFRLVQLIQGYEIVRNKNLLKSVSGSILAYDFGKDGNISTLSVTSGTSSTFLDFGYQCN